MFDLPVTMLVRSVETRAVVRPGKIDRGHEAFGQQRRHRLVRNPLVELSLGFGKQLGLREEVNEGARDRLARGRDRGCNPRGNAAHRALNLGGVRAREHKHQKQ